LLFQDFGPDDVDFDVHGIELASDLFFRAPRVLPWQLWLVLMLFCAGRPPVFSAFAGAVLRGGFFPPRALVP